MSGANMFQISGINRLRINTDGEGIRTLIVVHGCSLQCKYCINPQTWKSQEGIRTLSAAELYDEIILDRLYFISTRGGVTFGGGEPLLYADQIAAFKELCEGKFTIFAETALNVPAKNVEAASKGVDRFFVDIKAVDKKKYQAYTGGQLAVTIENLKYLLQMVGSERITVRIPIIPGLTTPEEQLHYRNIMKEMGITRFDLFNYSVKDK